MTRCPAPLKALASLIALALIAAGSPGCESGVDAPEVRDAYDRLIAALEARDADAVWQMTDPPTRAELEGFLTRSREAQALIPGLWGDPLGADAMRAFDAVGRELTEAAGSGADAGARLVSATLHMSDLKWTEGSREALSHPTIVLEESPRERAIVRVPSGESFTFERHEGAWYSTLVRDATLETGRFKGVLENIEKVVSQHAEAEAAKRRSLDARTVEGAWNLVRKAIGGGEEGAPALYAALDDASRQVVQEALETARKAQRRIQGRTSKALRPEAYEDAGIALAARADSDLSLFSAWWAANKLPPSLADDPPASFEAGAESGDKGTLVTAGGVRIALERRADGLWGLAELKPRLEADLLAPAKKATEADTARD